MPITTTLKRRTDTVTADDIRRAGIQLYPTEYAHADELIALWNDNIFYAPDQFRLLFDDLYNKGMVLTLRARNPQSVDFVVHDSLFNLEEHKQNNAGHTSFHWQRYDREFTEVRFSLTRVANQHQGEGLGTLLTSRSVDLDIVHGITKIKFDATLESGGYAWATKAYYVDRSDETKNNRAQNLSRQISTSLHCLDTVLPLPIFLEAQQYLDIKKPDDLFHLTHMDHDLSGLITPEDLSMGADLYLRFFGHYRDKMAAHGDAARMKQVVEFCQQKKKPLTVGRLLLTGRSYDAFANYNDPVQLQRMQDNSLQLLFSENTASRRQPQQTSGFTAEMRPPMM